MKHERMYIFFSTITESVIKVLYTLLLITVLVNTGRVYSQSASLVSEIDKYCIIENCGQADDLYFPEYGDVKYYAIMDGSTICFTPKGILQILNKKPSSNFLLAQDSDTAKSAHSSLRKKYQPNIYDISDRDMIFTYFPGSSLLVEIIAEDLVPGHIDFYCSKFKQKILGVQSYKKLIYKSIYVGIDMEILCKKNEIKYTFVVHPSADPSSIAINYLGHNVLAKISSHDILVESGSSWIREEKPQSFQKGRQIPTRFIKKQVGFGLKVSHYDDSKILIIDPYRHWGTYFGGEAVDEIFNINKDSNGNLLLLGSTNSTASIAVQGSQYRGNGDAFLTKFNPSGVRLWSIYVGGMGNDLLSLLDVDSQSNIYIAGTTSSRDILANLLGSNYRLMHQPTYGDGGDGIIIKFDSAGSPKWGTYYGGLRLDKISAIRSDGLGNVCIIGDTYSAENIADSAAFQQNLSGGQDGFVAMFDSLGRRTWGSYCGGSSDEALFKLVPYGDRIYVLGSTSSPSMASLPACETCALQGVVDALLFCLDRQGNPIWGRYIGGEGEEDITSLTVDTRGNVYVAGCSYSKFTTLPLPAYQHINRGNGDGFLASFSIDGESRWGTYFGGTEYDCIKYIETDSLGNIYVSGSTKSVDYVAFTGSNQKVFGGGDNDGFVAKFSDLDSAVVRQWSTYYGGNGIDEIRDFVLNEQSATLMLVGGTTSDIGISTQASHQDAKGGDSDGFIAHFNLDGSLLWGSYYGGQGGDDISRICIIDSQYYFVCGSTQSIGNIASPKSYQTLPGGMRDGFIALFGPCTLQFCPDLRHKSTIDTLSDVIMGGRLNIQGDFENIGTKTSKPSMIYVYISLDSTQSISYADPVLDSIPLRALASQERLETQFQVFLKDMPIPSGIYFLKIIIDPYNVLEEADESNNIRIIPVNVISACPGFIREIPSSPQVVSMDRSRLYSVSIDIDRPSVVVRAILWIKSISGSQWYEVPESSIKRYGNRVSFEFYDASDLGFAGRPQIGYEFYFEVLGPDSASCRLLSKKAYTYLRWDNLPLLQEYLAPGRDEIFYRIISVPYDLDRAKISDQLNNEFNYEYLGGAYDTTQWRLFHYNASLQKLQEYATLSFPDTFEIGKGYWIINGYTEEQDNERGLNLRLSNGVETPKFNSEDLFEWFLEPGWNQIGNPYPFSIRKEDILDINPAVNSENFLFFTFSTSGFQTKSCLEPFEGAYMYLDVKARIKVPILYQLCSNRRSSSIPLLRESLESGSWDAGLSFESGGVRQDLYGFGMRPDALPGKDRYDLVSLPRFFGLPDLRFAYDSLSLSKDVVPQAKGHIWTFEAAADPASQAAVLRWDNSYWGSGGLRLYLFDTRLQLPADMAARDSYTFRPEGGPRKFRIYFGSEEFVRQHMTPERIVLGEPFPNPSSGTVEIPLAFPQGLAPSALVISDAAGRAVRRIPLDGLAPGFHTVRWDGTSASGAPLPAGLYVCSIESEGGTILAGPGRILRQ